MLFTARPAPEPKAMPLAGYFAVVGAAVLGLLFVADATIVRDGRPSFVSDFNGLPSGYKGVPSSQLALYTPAPHIAPLPDDVAAVASIPQAAAQSAAAPAAASQAAKPVKRKVARKRPVHRDEVDDFDTAWRSSSSREPSWRDSWASGAFEQRSYESRRPQRRASRGGDDFWSFR